jgi:hypothetical protein
MRSDMRDDTTKPICVISEHAIKDFEPLVVEILQTCRISYLFHILSNFVFSYVRAHFILTALLILKGGPLKMMGHLHSCVML